jgi:two-component system response regulator BaeR
VRSAKAAGRDRVLPADAHGGAASQRLDVVVVEDDPVLGGLLMNSLETRGYSTHWLSDGQEAVIALSGAEPVLSPSLVLLDVDLPNLDGLSVLRRLAEDDVLESTRVILLTARAGEQEIVGALEVGAFDYVAKPFSLPVLMQRVRSALRR